MDKLDKVLEIVENYRKTADEVFSLYRKQEAEARKKYSPEGFQTEFILKRYPEYAGKLWSETNNAVNKVLGIFRQARNELNQWIMEPIKPGVLETLNYVRNFGLKLSFRELQIIEEGVSGSYFGIKIFSAIARDNGFNTEHISADTLIENLDMAESVTENTIRAYAGRGGKAGFPGRDLIHHKEISGVDFGEYSLPEMAIAAAPVKNGSIDAVRDLWKKAHAPLRYQLTQEETERIKKEIDGLTDRRGDIDTHKADKLLERIPDIVSRLDSLPTKESESVKSLKKYYILGRSGNEKGDTEPKAESILKASPAMQAAKNYAINHGQANADILNQY